MTDFLKQPLQIGDKTLSHRVVLAPLTRIRATGETLTPNDLMVEYYAQRASPGGLLISEGVLVSASSLSSRHVPGIFTDEQALGWKKVADAVHAKGGLISMQLWHEGAASHTSYNDHPLVKADQKIGRTCVSASNFTIPAAELDYHTGQHTPHRAATALTVDEIKIIHQEYVDAAHRAINIAGFDFVDLHLSHDYLSTQFASTSTNQRTDEYGGSLENRMRFTKELVEKVTTAFPGRVGARLSPHNNEQHWWGVTDDNWNETYMAKVKTVAQFPIVFLMLTEPAWNMFYTQDIALDPGAIIPFLNVPFMQEFKKYNKIAPVIVAGGMTPRKCYNLLNNNVPKEECYDGVGMGRYFISNPDLPFRMLNELPLTLYNRNTFYAWPVIDNGDGTKSYDFSTFAEGYTDYPTFEEQCAMHGFVLEEVMNDKEKMKELIAATQNDKYKLISIDEIGFAVNSKQRELLAKLKLVEEARARGEKYVDESLTEHHDSHPFAPHGDEEKKEEQPDAHPFAPQAV